MSIITWTADPATDETWALAEGPVWDAPRDRLLWVDIVGGAVLEGRLVPPADGSAPVRIETTASHAFDGTVGAVSADARGRLLVAGQEQFVVQDLDGARTPGPRLVAAGSGRRLNDAKPDPAGRPIVGTLPLAGDSTTEQLVRWESDGSLSVLDDDLALANGLAWSLDGSTFYSVDSKRHVVWARPYDVRTGATGPRAVFARVEDGEPDGLTIDAEGHLWVAVWGQGVVRRFTPAGELVGRLLVDAPHSSCPTFAGPDHDVLVVTSARVGLDDDALARAPHSGGLFTARIGVRGVPATPWRAPTAPTAPATA